MSIPTWILGFFASKPELVISDILSLIPRTSVAFINDTTIYLSYSSLISALIVQIAIGSPGRLEVTMLFILSQGEVLSMTILVLSHREYISAVLLRSQDLVLPYQLYMIES